MKPQTQNVPINEYDYDKVRKRHAFATTAGYFLDEMLSGQGWCCTGA